MLQFLKNCYEATKQKAVAVGQAAKSAALAVVGTVTGGVAALTTTVQEAHAALPASVGTTVTSIQTDGTAVFDLVFPVIATFVGLVVIIKLFKRFANKL